MSEELKPCPKCGGEVECESHYSTVYEEIRAMVSCKSCDFCQWFCDTLTFEKGNDIVSYHRGLPVTSIESYDELEINDLVIDQSGLFSYDWGFPKADVLYQLEEAFRKPVDMFRNLENIGIRSKIEYCGSKSGC